MSNVVETHIACPECGSSDARSIYKNDKGELWSVCFACPEEKRNRKVKDGEYAATESDNANYKHNHAKAKPMEMAESWAKAKSVSIPSRSITGESCNRYLVRVVNDRVLFPYFNADGILVGFKHRGLDSKDFLFDGTLKDTQLFGQKLFNKGGRYITITEGEYDAIAAYQMLGPKSSVISIKAGAQSALNDCKAQFEWLDSFENIILAFDADEEGQKAAKKIAELFLGKCKIVKLDPALKDSNGYLLAGKKDEFTKLWWDAEPYTPDGIIAGNTLLEQLKKKPVAAAFDYPYGGVNELTFGIRYGELVTVTAGSGLGKSQFLKEILYHILRHSNDNIGGLFLEESVDRSALGIMSLAANKPLHLPNTEYTEEEFDTSFKNTLGTGRIFFYDHFGSTSVDNIVARVRYMAKGLGCKVIFLDHISIVVSAQENGDERKAIDEIMTKLRMLVQETKIALIVVSHLKRPSDKGHEEGAATSLAQLRGSGSIAQLSDIVLSLERNGQAEDETERHTTKVRVLKNRFSGLTGPAGLCYYDKHTGRMTETFEVDSEPL